MIYSDKSVPGQHRLEAKMVKEGIVIYIEGGELFEAKNDKKHRLVVALQVTGIETTDPHKFGVCVYDDKGIIRLLSTKWSTLAESKAAAKAIALIAPQNFACAVVINNDCSK